MDSIAAHISPRRRIRRRWRIPPAIMHGPEALESAGMLDELPGSTGVILWQSLRDVTLWAGTPPAERAELFSPSAERNRIALLLSASLDPAIEQPLGMITAMVGQPGRVSAERVALACRRIAQWAENGGHAATALAFAQAGAVTCPGNAAAAVKVGQVARRRAEYVRAETWFRRAIALARQEGDWASYAMAFSGLGNLYLQRGSIPRARTLHTRALRAAKRHSLRGIQGDAFFDLHVLETAVDNAQGAQHYAREAFEAYGPRHPKIPTLAHDVAYFWLTQGCFEPALTVFQALLPQVGTSLKWIVVLPNIARAAAGMGDRLRFEQVWQEVWDHPNSQEAAEHCAEAFLELAHGAISLGDWEKAKAAASRALTFAQARREARIVIRAEEKLLEAMQHESAAVQRAGTPSASPGDYMEIADLATDFVRSLEACAGA